MELILVFSDHYYAHWLLTEAIDDYNMLYTFTAMHRQDIKLGRIEEKELISKEEFQNKMKIVFIEDSKLKKKLYTKDSLPIKKMIETRNKTYINEDGNPTSIDKEARLKQVKTREKKSKIFNLFHIDKGLIKRNLMRKEIIKISQGLLKTSKDKYLGKQSNSRYNLIKNNNENLIGLYVEEQLY